MKSAALALVRKYSKASKPKPQQQQRGLRTRNPRITINVSGQIYETHAETLGRFPDTLLGDPEKRLSYQDSRINEFFFERGRMFFDSILFFYQSGGILKCPTDVPYQLFVKECRFFQLSEEVIQRAKPTNFKCAEGTLEDKEEDDEHSRPDLSGAFPRLKLLKSRIWDVLQRPRTSRLAHWFSIVSLLAVVLSVFSSCLQSVPQLNVETKVYEDNPW